MLGPTVIPARSVNTRVSRNDVSVNTTPPAASRLNSAKSAMNRLLCQATMSARICSGVSPAATPAFSSSSAVSRSVR